MFAAEKTRSHKLVGSDQRRSVGKFPSCEGLRSCKRLRVRTFLSDYFFILEMKKLVSPWSQHVNGLCVLFFSACVNLFFLQARHAKPSFHPQLQAFSHMICPWLRLEETSMAASSSWTRMRIAATSNRPQPAAPLAAAPQGTCAETDLLAHSSIDFQCSGAKGTSQGSNHH